jgi:hypothetical protein
MPPLAEDLLLLKQIQVDIRAAIEAHGVAVGPAPFVDYPTFIAAIGVAEETTDMYWDGDLLEWDLDGDTLIWELDE